VHSRAVGPTPTARVTAAARHFVTIGARSGARRIAHVWCDVTTQLRFRLFTQRFGLLRSSVCVFFFFFFSCDRFMLQFYPILAKQLPSLNGVSYWFFRFFFFGRCAMILLFCISFFIYAYLCAFSFFFFCPDCCVVASQSLTWLHSFLRTHRHLATLPSSSEPRVVITIENLMTRPSPVSRIASLMSSPDVDHEPRRCRQTISVRRSEGCAAVTFAATRF